jgi:hypothetical protein
MICYLKILLKEKLTTLSDSENYELYFGLIHFRQNEMYGDIFDELLLSIDKEKLVNNGLMFIKKIKAGETTISTMDSSFQNLFRYFQRTSLPITRVRTGDIFKYQIQILNPILNSKAEFRNGKYYPKTREFCGDFKVHV